MIASRIAAHAADLARGIDKEKDNEFSKAREDLNWEKMFELCIDPKKARDYRENECLWKILKRVQCVESSVRLRLLNATSMNK